MDMSYFPSYCNFRNPNLIKKQLLQNNDIRMSRHSNQASLEPQGDFM